MIFNFINENTDFWQDIKFLDDLIDLGESFVDLLTGEVEAVPSLANLMIDLVRHVHVLVHASLVFFRDRICDLNSQMELVCLVTQTHSVQFRLVRFLTYQISVCARLVRIVL